VKLAEAFHALNPEQAIARLQALRASHPGSLPVLLGLAHLQSEEGHFDEAYRLLQQAEGLAKGDASVREAQRQLERARRDSSRVRIREEATP
jgi:hypothetical protein